MKHKRSIISIAMATIMVVSLCAVCASTSVSAAPSSSKASVKATPSLVGSPIAAGTGPAACILKGSLSMYVFVKGYDGALWYRIWSLSTDTWAGNWISLGGQLSSSPCAVSRSSGYIDVYVAGTNGAVYQKAYNGAWHNWYTVGGKVLPGTGPAASGWTNCEYVFVTGTNGALYRTVWTQASQKFYDWENLGGKLTSSPAAVSRQFGMINVYVRGTTGAVYQKAYDGVWHAWANLGGVIASGTGPGLCSYTDIWGTDREDVFVQGTNGAMYQKTWTEESGWSPTWVNLGRPYLKYLSASPTAATYTLANKIQIFVFVRGTDGALYLQEYYWGLWRGWNDPYQGPP